MPRRRFLPPLTLAAALAAQQLMPRRRPRLRTDLAAAGLAAASVGLWWGSAAWFTWRGTTVDPDGMDRSSLLITDGPSAVTRNPMYVGMAGLLLAHALHLRSVVALLPVAGYVATMDRIQIPAEEAALTEIFGTAFTEYQERTPRWL